MYSLLSGIIFSRSFCFVSCFLNCFEHLLAGLWVVGCCIPWVDCGCGMLYSLGCGMLHPVGCLWVVVCCIPWIGCGMLYSLNCGMLHPVVWLRYVLFPGLHVASLRLIVSYGVLYPLVCVASLGLSAACVGECCGVLHPLLCLWIAFCNISLACLWLCRVLSVPSHTCRCFEGAHFFSTVWMFKLITPLFINSSVCYVFFFNVWFFCVCVSVCIKIYGGYSRRFFFSWQNCAHWQRGRNGDHMFLYWLTSRYVYVIPLGTCQPARGEAVLSGARVCYHIIIYGGRSRR